MVCAPRLQQFHRLLAAGLRPWGQGLTLATLLLLGGTALAQTPASNPAPPAAAPTVSGGRIVRPTLRLGSQGESVRELQSMLVLLGFYPGPVSGIYQEDTQTAVQRFQQAAAITADGIVGPATWSQLFPAPAAEASPPNLVSNTTTPSPNAPRQRPHPPPHPQRPLHPPPTQLHPPPHLRQPPRPRPHPRRPPPATIGQPPAQPSPPACRFCAPAWRAMPCAFCSVVSPPRMCTVAPSAAFLAAKPRQRCAGFSRPIASR